LLELQLHNLQHCALCST